MPDRTIYKIHNGLQLDGKSVVIGAETVNVKLADSAGLIMHCSGTTLPTDGGAGYAKGCEFVKTDAATGVSGSYKNTGTSTACAFTLVQGAVSQAVTATVDGLTTGIIAAQTKHATVTSSASTKIVTLPAPVVGNRLVVDVGANGFKLQTTAPATIAINGGSGASAVSAIAANSTIELICISLTAWKAIFWDADADVAKVPAAA